MRSETGQRMLEWASVTPERTVAIDVSESVHEGKGRAAQGHENTSLESSRRGGGEGLLAQRRAAETQARFGITSLSRELVMDEIITLNGAATVGFLSEFEDSELRLYLGRLRSARLGRGGHTVSERSPGRSAITAHRRRS